MIRFRKANSGDVELFFNWANDSLVRNNSYRKEQVIYEEHVKWFENQIYNNDNYFYVFIDDLNLPIGQVRINKLEENKAVIGLMIDVKFRGRGFAKEMIKISSDDFLITNINYTILAYIFTSNKSSYKSFKQAGYELLKEEIVNEIPSFILFKKK
jgi:spore coat polysaccharide biosynthesis protein SpsF